jgi:hypothetical protein
MSMTKPAVSVRSIVAGVFIGLGLTVACRPEPSAPTPPPPSSEPTISGETTDLEELHAFAKLYGYVRFFHPSDEAAAADWDRVAIEGARRVVQGSTRAQLLASLREIFEPLAPTLLVFPIEHPPPAAEPARDGRVLAWQHEGYGFGEMVSAYFSGRTGRARAVPAQGLDWAPLIRSVAADQVRGKRVRLRGWARVDGKHRSEKAQLWVRVDGPAGGPPEFFDNMQERPIQTTQWQEATIESTPIGPKATNVVFGGLAMGSGAVYFDDLTLETADPGASTWTEVALDNGGFEADDALSGWRFQSDSHTASPVADAHAGRTALKIERKHGTVKGDLFEERPRVGETFERSLGSDLSCRVVLGLPASKAKSTQAPTQATLPDGSDEAVRAAAVVVAWNVLRHFYPYHDVIGQDAIGEDWEQVLDLAITDVLDDRGPEDLQLTLRRLVHHLHDGHGNVRGPVSEGAFLPLRIARVEGTFVVLAAPKSHPVQRGDELVSIDGVAMDELFEQHAALVSGSPQWIEYQLLAWGRITHGQEGTPARVEVRRSGTSQVLDLERATGVFPPDEFDRPYFKKLARGVLYVDLVRIPDEELTKRMPELAKARGVIVDVRGYPRSEPTWLAHFLTASERAKWMFVPHVIRPDYESVTTFTEHAWDMDPAEPHVAGKVAFITGPGAISYAESLMGYVEGYQLGAIVGSATSGANGNVNPFAVPGGFTIVFTGMKVTRMDGRQHHIIGVQPTHPVSRTLAGIRAGRDEELEAALLLVRP